MPSLKWYPRDPRAALSGMMKLTLEECGAYNKVLDLIYLRQGKLVDDPDEICRWLNCKPRVWKRIRAKLMNLGKLYVHAGCLHNERCDDEIIKFRDKRLRSVEMNDKRWATYREINGLQRALGLQYRDRKESLSANIVPIAKKDSRDK